ncbi:hypothetical protein [Saccharicrinis fermentans]|uniref:hypothetical protein n=1 Tax=Saccharicrinis fermentans TaxID=982 RepID=UPI0012B6104D|nr:hypothetical protein [Saccharicrinis fermentans]
MNNSLSKQKIYQSAKKNFPFQTTHYHLKCALEAFSPALATAIVLACPTVFTLIDVF